MILRPKGAYLSPSFAFSLAIEIEIPFCSCGEENEVDKRSYYGKTTRKSGQGWSFRQLPEGCGEQEKMESAGCEVVSGTPTIRTGYGKSAVKNY